MITIGDDPEAQLIALARTWFRLLARAKWEAALTMLDEPNSYGIRWTKESIIATVNEAVGPDTRFGVESGVPVFSDPDVATGTPHDSFDEFDSGGYWPDHDVPLNGAFSDLTAQFEFHARPGGHSVVLHDLHVL